jgi:hypothetical protein
MPRQICYGFLLNYNNSREVLELTIWGKVVLEELIVSQLIEKLFRPLWTH